MTPTHPASSRRKFLKATVGVATGITGLSMIPGGMQALAGEAHPLSGNIHPLVGQAHPLADDVNIIGPKEGYSPQIGTLVSMMAWMRMAVLRSVKGMTTEELDFLLDDKANTIGAMLFHLAATDAFYHEHTFTGVDWGKWDKSVEEKFAVPMMLGDSARKKIKGNNLDFYINVLGETREKTLVEFRKKDDAWLLAVDTKWSWGPTNTYCKWFHVCEHESNHNGQIKFLKSRLPGAKKSGD